MSDSEQRSEAPSPHRLRKARADGDSAVSATLTMSIGFGSTLIALLLLGDMVKQRISNLLSHAFSSDVTTQLNVSLEKTITPMIWDALLIVSPFLAVLLVASTVAGLIQTRGMFSLQRIRINPGHMNPSDRLQQRFSTMQLFDFIKTLIKFFLIAGALYLVVTNSIKDLVAGMFDQSLWNGMAMVSGNIILMAAIATLIYLVMGIIDYGHQYFEFIKRNRMSRSEVNEEMRDLYGDPLINSHLRGQRESITMGSQTPPNAQPSVIVTNPTHFAVALFYEPDVVELPIVIGKGRGEQALKIRVRALEQGIPVAERPPLARHLYRTLTVGQPISEADLESVAEVFRWLKKAEHPTTFN